MEDTTPMLTALILSVVVLLLVWLLFVANSQIERIVPRTSELNMWDKDLESARDLRELAARCKAARGVRKNV